jgi:hypothetical protein
MTFNDLLLIEGIGKRTLHHYTDYSSLLKILRDKKIDGYQYPGGKDDEVQVATVRPSMANPKNLKHLGSSTDGGVDFIIDASALSDKVRGAKIKTIAELPFVSLKEIRKKHPVLKDVKKTNALIKKIEKTIKKVNKGKNYRAQELAHKVVNDLILNGVEILEDKYDNRDLLFFVVSKVIMLSRFHNNREGEERVSLKNKKAGIPLNKKYIKIELKEFPPNFSKKGLKEALLKNKDLFIQNNIYKEIIEEM